MKRSSSREGSGIFEIISQSAGRTLSLGRRLSRRLRQGDIICLFGPLGSGKTVLTKGIAQGLGIAAGKVVSPSFVLIRQYTKARLPLYHFDLYRLHSLFDITGLGYEEYLYGNGITVIEWADRLKGLLPREYLKVEIEAEPGSKRLLRFSAEGVRYKELLAGIRKDFAPR